MTLFSPAASMLHAVTQLAAVTDPRQQVLLTMQLAEAVPALGGKLDVDPSMLKDLETFLRADPRQVLAKASRTGNRAEVEDVYRMSDQVSSMWGSELPAVETALREQLGAVGLADAVAAGVLRIDDLHADSANVIEDSVRHASGDRSGKSVDQLIGTFVQRTLTILSSEKDFPLLDAEASGLIRALEREAGLTTTQGALHRGAEVSAAARFMSHLPYFADLPMDEVLDLRRSVAIPLVRFRGNLARMSKQFSARLIDREFEADVDDAWRSQVEPALVDLREHLAEHGLLREVASVALGDPRRLIAEAGGVLLAAVGSPLSLSMIVTALASVGVPAADVFGRGALAATRQQQALLPDPWV